MYKNISIKIFFVLYFLFQKCYLVTKRSHIYILLRFFIKKLHMHLIFIKTKNIQLNCFCNIFALFALHRFNPNAKSVIPNITLLQSHSTSYYTNIANDQRQFWNGVLGGLQLRRGAVGVLFGALGGGGGWRLQCHTNTTQQYRLVYT